MSVLAGVEKDKRSLNRPPRPLAAPGARGLSNPGCAVGATEDGVRGRPRPLNGERRFLIVESAFTKHENLSQMGHFGVSRVMAFSRFCPHPQQGFDYPWLHRLE